VRRALFWGQSFAVVAILYVLAVKIRDLAVYCTVLGAKGQVIERIPCEVGLLFAVIAWTLLTGTFVVALVGILAKRGRKEGP